MKFYDTLDIQKQSIHMNNVRCFSLENNLKQHYIIGLKDPVHTSLNCHHVIG